ncbi:MAG: branched-chain-amino-acid transaminase [Elusimicrobia bacterium]|nr:branched-chain-amino-acid transaminase [Elusimicrobiota bacterium]
MKIYIDGKHYEKEEARISVFDHGLLYGDGVFEGIRAYNGRVFRLAEHVERLYASAKGILLDCPLTPKEMEEAILETLRLNRLRDAYIRVVLTRGMGDLGLDMRKCKKATLVIIADTIELYPPSFYEKGLELITAHIRRTPHECLSPNIKSLNYLNNILAKNTAVRAGAQEAILLNLAGYVAECAGDNIFFLKDRRVWTPPVWAGILEGITRRTAIDLVREKLKLPVQEDPFTLFQLYGAEEVFVTGTGAEILGAVKIDGRIIGNGKPGPFTQRLTALYRELTRATGTPIYDEKPVASNR